MARRRRRPELTGVYHERVRSFRRELLRTTLAAHGGNRTHAARALGLQRTYLLRLIRQLRPDESNGRG